MRVLSLLALAAAAVAQSSSAPAPAASVSPTTATTAGPYWHSFINDTIANATLWPKAATIDFNKVSLAGYRSTELRGAAGSFANLTAEERKAIVDDFHAAGKTLRVSAFGANDNVTSNGADPELLATNLASYARTNGLDGVDINYEGGSRLTELTQTARRSPTDRRWRGSRRSTPSSCPSSGPPS